MYEIYEHVIIYSAFKSVKTLIARRYRFRLVIKWRDL